MSLAGLLAATAAFTAACTRPGYAEYAARTPAFVPWFPRRPR